MRGRPTELETSEDEAVETWLQKLDRRVPLTEAEAAALRSAFSSHGEFAAGKAVVPEGEPPSFAGALVEGVLLRCRWTPEGRRQILGLIVPGDLVEPYGFLLAAMDHSIMAKTPARIALATPRAVATLTEGHPRLRDDFIRDTLIAASIHREWIVSCGQRSGHARVAHLLSEWIWRVVSREPDRDLETPFPLSQIDIADAVGLSPVHVNRILQAMKTHDLASIKNGRLRTPDWAALAHAASFDPAYLHATTASRQDPLRRSPATSEGETRGAPWLLAQG